MTKDDEEISINGNTIEKEENCVFYGSVVPSATKDVKSHVNLAS